MLKLSIPGRRMLLFLLFLVLGLLTGRFLAVRTDPSLLIMVRRAAGYRVSIIGSLLTALLPFLIAAYAVLKHNDLLLFAAGFFRALCYGCLAWLTVRSFGTSAWLVQPILQFMDGATLLIYIFFGVLCCRNEVMALRWPAALCITSAAAVSVLDYLVVSPFLASLLEF